jgi:hypothetical protein
MPRARRIYYLVEHELHDPLAAVAGLGLLDTACEPVRLTARGIWLLTTLLGITVEVAPDLAVHLAELVASDVNGTAARGSYGVVRARRARVPSRACSRSSSM